VGTLGIHERAAAVEDLSVSTLCRKRERVPKCVSTWQGNTRNFVVIPAKAGTQCLCSSTSMSFSAPSHGAGYFCSDVGARLRATVSNKPQAAVHGSLPRPHVRVRALAGARQCRAKARLALSRAPACDARRHATAPETHFDTAIHGLGSSGLPTFWVPTRDPEALPQRSTKPL
jgi:hypothetical protein